MSETAEYYILNDGDGVAFVVVGVSYFVSDLRSLF